MNQLNQKGFSPIDTFIVLLVVALLAVIGIKVHDTNSSQASIKQPTSTTSASQETTNAATIPAVSNKSDLDKMSSALDDNDTTGANSSDDSALSSQANDF